eukprot:CAMPEP_0168554590 /NCGR_PEP_ID=MMETSP0413-20121227/7863_1 /TAXON_ID=136452 /ORGANISM="Filamoeba nolandi, Strain NC-AS-23-1" /LENGTH=375 /DNA_ID=CAMNT_0008585345 /DNA_START=37 /DNA_END=1164 /DNA_ORIENTATION=+
MRSFATFTILLVGALLSSISAQSWRLEPAGGDVPPPRGGARLVNADGTLFYWGGFYECFDARSTSSCDHFWYDDLYHYNLNDGSWELVTPTSANGQFPERRAFFGANYWDQGDVVVIFGGIRYNVTLSFFLPFGDIWFYSVEDQEWAPVQPVNEGPGIRIAPNVAIYRNEMFVFGGLKPTFEIANDMWKFNLVTRKWTLLIPEGAAGSPGPIYLGSFRLDEAHRNVILMGGNIPIAASGAQSNQTWSYSIRDNTWTELAFLQRGRIHNAAEIFANKFVTAFGDAENLPGDPNGCRTPEASAGQSPINEVLSLNLLTNQWSSVNAQGGPGPLKRVMSTRVGNRMYVVGGYNFLCPDGPTTLGFPVWNTNMYSLRLV